MSSSTLYRLSGLALILGALLDIVGNVLSTVLLPDTILPTRQTSALFASLSALILIATALLVLGLPGIVVRQGAQAGWLGLVGFLLTILSQFMFMSDAAINFLIDPWLSVNASPVATKLNSESGPPALLVNFVGGSLLLALGGILLGIATMRAKVFPEWAGLLIMVGPLLGLHIALPISGIIRSTISTVSVALFALGLGWIGYALWRTKGRDTSTMRLDPTRNC